MWSILVLRRCERHLKKRVEAVAQEILVFSESEADGDFAYHMEDVLEVYCQPYDPAVPRICMDEMGKNTGHQTNMRPNEASPGQVAREDYTYEREGRANLFIAYEPLAGKRLRDP